LDEIKYYNGIKNSNRCNDNLGSYMIEKLRRKVKNILVVGCDDCFG